MSKFRRIEFTYSVTVPEAPRSESPIHLWAPFPRSTPHQELCAIEVHTGMPYEIAYDAIYGNPVLHAVADTANNAPFDIIIKAQVTRHERAVSLRDVCTSCSIPKAAQSAFKHQLSESRLIRFSPEIIDIAAKIQEQHQDPVGIARAAYEHVLERMAYDKSGSGWGEGSSEFACSIGKGNCTDFHSLFLAMIRACGIPGEFEIGVAFPPGTASGDITAYKCGYHCWTSFYAPTVGWVPVDCSEAAQKPGLRDYYFGTIDENRLLLSYGRDIRLPGRRDRAPINFFTDPVVETDDGEPEYYVKTVTFRDM